MLINIVTPGKKWFSSWLSQTGFIHTKNFVVTETPPSLSNVLQWHTNALKADMKKEVDKLNKAKNEVFPF